MGALDTKPTDYQADLHTWSREQAAALRRLAALRLNLPVTLDLEHLAEEIEELGDNSAEVVEGLLVQVIIHLLKLEYAAETEPRRHWRAEIAAFRGTLRRRLRRSPSVVHAIDLNELYDEARGVAAQLLGEQQLPDACPYTLAELRDPGFFPPSRLSACG